MASFHLPFSNSSELLIQDKYPDTKTGNFNQIPSWISLNRCRTSIKPNQNETGLIENLHLVSLCKQGKLKEVQEFLKNMDMAGISVNTHSYECLLETCGKQRSLSDGKLIHEQLRRTVKNPSGFLENCLLQVYCDCGSFSDAQTLFDEMSTKDSVSWGIMISAHAQKGIFADAFRLFSEMNYSGVNPNHLIYITLIRALSSPSCIELGKQIHSHLIRNGLTLNVLIGTSLLNMYVKCGCLRSSKLVFDQMAEKNAVTWTGLMMGYSLAEKHEEAVALLDSMIRENVQLDEFVFSVILKACSALEDLDIGRQIHGYIIKIGMDSKVSVGTPLVDFYVKCGDLEDARKAFERISDPNDTSWSILISGYSQFGKLEESLGIFKYVRSRGIYLNYFTYTTIFQTCSTLADLNLGTQVHGDAIKKGLISGLYGESALVSMYSRCGMLDDAFRAFELISEPDTVAWTAIISGCAYHGHALEALRLFRRMKKCGVKPNEVTFIGVLTACSHSGMVSEAEKYLGSMNNEYGVDPTIDHYACMVDIYSRAGLFEEALELMRIMPFEPDIMCWKSLLGGCWTHRNVKLGMVAAENLLKLDSNDTAGYILMFNLYTSFGKWEEAAHIRMVMSERNLRKDVSCSWITIKGKVHRFIVGDRHHAKTKEIYLKLDELNYLGTNNGSTLFTSIDPSNNFHERKEQLLDHSERLAIAFGLISASPKSPIMVFKNLRACNDCHDFAKQVSMITEREIVVRDWSRFHHFKHGKCSCDDYW